MTGLVRRHPAACAAAVVALVVGAPLVAGARFSGLDHTRNLVPTLCAHEAGRLILDPLRGDGVVLQDPLGLAFSPTAHLATAVLSPEAAASFFSWAWLVLAAACGAYFAGSFGASWRGRLAGGLAQALFGTTVDLVLHGPYVIDAALLPLCWGGARNLRRLHEARGRDVAAVAAGLGLLALDGSLQMAFAAGCLVVAEGVAAAVGPRRSGRDAPPGPPRSPSPSPSSPSRRGRALLLAASALAGTLLACAQLLPSAGLGGAVARVHGVESTTAWPLKLPEALGVVLPLIAYHRFDDGATLVSAWHGGAARIAWTSSPFLGAIACAALLALAVPWVRRTRDGRAGFSGLVRAARWPRRSGPLVVVAAVSLALATASPLLTVALAVIPPLRLFRYPAKYFELTSLCAAAAVALVVDAAARSPGVRRRMRAALGVVAALLAVAAVVVVVERGAVDAAAARAATRAPVDALPSLFTGALTALGRSLGFSVVALLALSRPRTARFLPVIAVAEIALAAAGALPFSRPVLDVPRPLQALPAGAELCIGHGIRAVHLDDAGGDLQLTGDTLADVIDGKPNIGACGGPATPDDYMPSAQATVVRMSRYLLDEEHGVIGPARALGCTHIATRAPVVGLTRVPLAAPAPPVFAVPDALPDVAVARHPRLVEDTEVLLRDIAASTSAAGALSLVDDPGDALGDRALPDGAGAGDVVARFASPTAGTVTMGGSGGAVVVVRRQWWPGWRAEQAGAALPVVRAAGRELAVVVDDVRRGPVTLRYEVRGLAAGLAASGAGALLLAALVLLAARRRRAAAPSRR